LIVGISNYLLRWYCFLLLLYAISRQKSTICCDRALFFIFPFVLIVIIATTAPFLQKKHFLELISPQKIVIDQEQGYISVMMGKQANTFNKSLEAIKLVIDRGEWYYLKLRFPKIGGIICQKNLIVQGTIEEFEALFKNKIKEVK